jgi:hypothetical protein
VNSGAGSGFRSAPFGSVGAGFAALAAFGWLIRSLFGTGPGLSLRGLSMITSVVKNWWLHTLQRRRRHLCSRVSRTPVFPSHFGQSIFFLTRH